MHRIAHTTKATFIKELKLWRRDPKVFLGSMLPPLLVLVVFYMLFGNIAALPVAVTDLDEGSDGAKLVELLKNTRSPLGNNYFKVYEVARGEADQLYTAEEVVATLVIPEDFSTGVLAATGGSDAGPELHLRLNNVNSDLAKNIRLYLAQCVGRFYKQYYPSITYELEEDSDFGVSVPWFAEIGMGLIAFSISLAGMFNGATALLKEYEDNTIKELLLAPAPVISKLAGKVLLALSGAMVSGVVMYLAVYAFSGHLPGPLWASAVAAGLLLALAYTGVGVIYALVFKRYIPAAFSSVLTGFTCWLLGGALGPVPTDGSLLAHIAPWIPTRHAIAVFRDAMVWRDPLQLNGHLASLTGLLVLIALAAALSLRWGFQLE